VLSESVVDTLAHNARVLHWLAQPRAFLYLERRVQASMAADFAAMRRNPLQRIAKLKM
jgi:hypothetical protein